MHPNRLLGAATAAALVALVSGYVLAADAPSNPAVPAGAGATSQSAPPGGAAAVPAGQDDEDEGMMAYGPGWGGYGPRGYGPGMRGGYGPGGGWGGGPGGMHGGGPGWMYGGGYGPGMRGGYGPGGGWGGGPGWMHGGGPGWMYGGGNGPGWMPGPGMMWGGEAEANGWCPGGAWAWHHDFRQALNLSVQDVKNRFERWLSWRANPHLKLGAIKESGPGTISVEIVTQDNSLVQRFEVNRYTGRIVRAD